ncbi:EamA family transporter [Rothia sp. ZJ1223]|uniref:EamA family transporter n=1 Tax=Rothia sp. ZJ1223 TaxID=2811098 RepID=UPI00195A463D|nr:EamA family transporter [Rothia sp. ZJ1223]
MLLGWEAAHNAELSLLGMGYALIAGFFWALYITGSEKVGRVVPGNGGLAGAMVVGALMTIPAGGTGALSVFGDAKLLLFAIGTGLMASVVPCLAELAALRRLPRHIFSILLSLEPAIAALAGWMLLAQHSGVLRWAAMVMLMVASLGITFTSRQEARANSRRLEQAT